eukprot:1027293-Rhodomonas_salina.1
MVTLSVDPALVAHLAAVKGTDKLNKASKLNPSDSVAVIVQVPHAREEEKKRKKKKRKKRGKKMRVAFRRSGIRVSPHVQALGARR